MKKRILSVLLSLIMCLGVITFSRTANAEQPIKVKLNDKTLNFEVQPQIIDDCTMVSMRVIFEELGYEVEWRPEGQYVCAVDMTTLNCIVMYIGEKELYTFDYYEFMESAEPEKVLKEHAVSMEAPAQIINDNTLVPVRAVSEVSGYDVEWDSSNRTVLIYDPVYKKNLTEKKSSMIKTEYNKILSLYNPQNDKYAVYDIDKDNIPELIVKSGTCEVDYKYIYYSYCNNSATKIGEHSGMHTSLMTYPDANGIVNAWMHQGGGALYLVSYESGVLNERELIPAGFVSTNDVAIDAFLPNSSFIDMYPVNSNAHLSDVDKYLNKDIDLSIKEEKPSNGTVYDNVIVQLNQIRKLMDDGLYLEAMALCDSTLQNYNLSPSDRAVLESLKEGSARKYEGFVEYNNLVNPPTRMWFADGWRMSFSYAETATVEMVGENVHDERIVIQEPGKSLDQSIIIYSFEVGSIGPHNGDIIWNTTQAVNSVVNFWRGLSREWKSDGYGSTFEVLSNSSTQVGTLPAVQATVRTTGYNDRYHTTAEYVMQKFIAYQYGNYIYLIEAREDVYEWTDVFWNRMETLRTSISFY